jgi:adenosine/AMP kinase
LAAQQPELKDFSGLAKLIQYGANATEVINMITNAAPHCATLAICAGHKIIIIHHFKHDFNTLVTLDGMDELCTLLGNGATALPVQANMSSVHGFSSVTPTFKALSEATDLEALCAQPLPSAAKCSSFRASQ